MVTDINKRKATSRIIYKFYGLHMRRSPAAAAGISAINLAEMRH